MDPLISVVIPVYNMEAYLARCLDSILENTYKNLEILCVDDGSKDRSLAILREYAARDPRIVVIAKENGGVSSARNAGLDRMTGEYVAFVDPDDYVHPQYFALLYRIQQSSDVDLSVCGYMKVMDGEEAAMPSLTFEALTVKRLNCREFFRNRACRSFCWGRLIRCSALKGLHFLESVRYAEDAVFTAALWEANPTLTCAAIENPLYYYVQREGSAVKEAGERDRLIVAKLFAERSCLSPRNEEIYLEQTLRRVLNSRYYAVHIFPDREAVKTCKEALKVCLPVLRRTRQLSRSEKIRYTIFARFPFIYWLFRVKTDPGMWKWEKAERKKRRHQ